MKVLKTLEVTFEDKPLLIRFGHPETEEELHSLFELRARVYTRYGYLSPEFTGTEESDEYDEKKQCVYFYAEIEGRPIGFIRLLKSDILPIQKSFTFEMPPEVAQTALSERCELGRLIVERYSEKGHSPRNVILLFLMVCLVEYGIAHSIKVALSFLKSNLIGKLQRLKVPFVLIEPNELIYPKNGLMAPYFFSEEDPVKPAYFTLEAMREYLDKEIHNARLFEEKESGHFVLQHTLYARFLQTLGIL